MVRSSSSSAVQRNASGASGGRLLVSSDAALIALMASETIGPCREMRTSTVTGSPPLT